ncbi:hypothetical protein BTE77_31945 [Ensifer adhaerens]|nr:hypothetical protein BTE77_31945 [Ensifer adhaerens]
MTMICSSVKRLRFIPWSSQWARAYFKMDYFNGARSRRMDLCLCPVDLKQSLEKAGLSYKRGAEFIIR